MHELERRSVRLHAEHTGAEPLLLAADHTTVGRIANCAPDPVVETIAEIRWSCVGITRAPASIQDLAHVSLVITVCIFQEEEVWNVSDNNSSAGECQ